MRPENGNNIVILKFYYPLEVFGGKLYIFLSANSETSDNFFPAGSHSKRMTGRRSTDKPDDPVRSRGTIIFPGESSFFLN